MSKQQLSSKQSRRKKYIIISAAVVFLLFLGVGAYILVNHTNKADTPEQQDIATQLPKGLAAPVASSAELTEGDDGLVRWLAPQTDENVTTYSIRITSDLCPDLNTTFSVKAIDSKTYESNTPTKEKPYTDFFKLNDTYMLNTTVLSCVQNDTGAGDVRQEIATAHITAKNDTKQSEELSVAIFGRLFK